MKNELPLAVLFCSIAALANGYVGLMYGMKLSIIAALLCLFAAGASGWGWWKSKQQ